MMTRSGGLLITKIGRGPGTAPVLQSRRGFTLVELIVVLAMVTVLVALLLPTLAQARERGRQGVCTSQLRQIGQAFAMYRQDYGADPPWRSFGERLQPFLKDERLWVCPSHQAPPGVAVAVSYLNLVDGDRRWDTDKPLTPRSVIVYCDSHTSIRGYDRQRGGTPLFNGAYLVLRHDGAVEPIPAGQVKMQEKPARSPAPGGIANDVLLEFPE
jgi:prepilin-type N-terminal cleavage/methylation domain-containing protein